jgi:hypothetical protein
MKIINIFTKHLLVILFLFINTLNGFTQNFSLSNGTSSYFNSTIKHRGRGITFGDFDNDNDLDLIIIGTTYTPTILYKNNGQGWFTPYHTAFPKADLYYNIISSDIKWFDYNNDGLLDLLFYNTINYKFFVYKNTGNPTTPFVLVSNYNGSKVLGCGPTDIYRNGLQDIYILANNNGNNLFKNISNVSSNPFTIDNQSVTNTPSQGFHIIYTSVFDANKDGFGDIYAKFKGEGGACYFTGKRANPKLELRTAMDPYFLCFFTQAPPVDLNGNGNYNVIREAGQNSEILEFQNDTVILINTTNFSIVDHCCPDFQLLDFNNDGKIDITFKSVFYTNNGNLNFSISGYMDSIKSMPVIADIDNDNDIDFFASATNKSYMFINNDSTSNTPPATPQTLWVTMDSSFVTFHWRKTTDAETPQPSLTYNLMVGTSSKAINITSPLSDTATGYRRVVEPGNAFMNNFYILDKSIFNLGDTVYWSVQTIDNGFGYSPFSKENSAVIYGHTEEPDFDTICSNDSLLWRGSYYHTSGRYKQAFGLDSAFFLDLKVNPSYLNEQKVDICSGQSYQWNGQIYNQSGTYQLWHTSVNGCDSIERLVLKVWPDFTNLQSAVLCAGDSLAFGGGYLKTPGVYDDSLTGVHGCDSVVRLTLSVMPQDTNVTLSGDTLKASSATALIRWIDCPTQTYVPYAAGQVFVPGKNGYYAAEITENGCSYQTRCFHITGLGIDNGNKVEEVKVVPNPNTGKFVLDLGDIQAAEVSILNSLGQVIIREQVTKSRSFDLDLQNGIYFIEIRDDNYFKTFKLIIK